MGCDYSEENRKRIISHLLERAASKERLECGPFLQEENSEEVGGQGCEIERRRQEGNYKSQQWASTQRQLCCAFLIVVISERFVGPAEDKHSFSRQNAQIHFHFIQRK